MTIMSIESFEEADTLDKEEMRKSKSDVMDKYSERIEFFYSSYIKSDLRVDHEAKDPEASNLDQTHVQLAPWCYQFGLLAKRNFLNLMRLPSTSYVKLIVTIATALLCIILFYNVEDSQQGIQNRNGALFFISMSMAFNAI